MKADIIEEFRWRGLLYDQTEGAAAVLKEQKVTAYIGFDPTADSLHIGNLVPIMALVHLQRHGHRPLALVGGATGMIGDPSGKSKERNLLTTEQLAANVVGIRRQLERFLDFEHGDNAARMINNADWFGSMKFIDFMRNVGKHFSVAAMLAKESVKRRINDEGISFTEFSYMLLQAYDFSHLYQTMDCSVQMGASDQWGNITAGVDLVRRMHEGKAQGVVFPLITSSSGAKFGKTEAGAVWLDPARTSPYKFYQFWLNTDDASAIAYLKIFTLLEEDEVAAIERATAESPQKREAQKRLAAEVTGRVHGPGELAKAVTASRAMFGGGLDQLNAREIGEIFNEVPSTCLPKTAFDGEGYPILDLFVDCGVTRSKGETRRLLQGGGINVNNVRMSDVNQKVVLADSVEDAFVVLRKGGKTYHLVKLEF